MEPTTEDQSEKWVAYGWNNCRQAPETWKQLVIVCEGDIWSSSKPKSQIFSIKDNAPSYDEAHKRDGWSALLPLWRKKSNIQHQGFCNHHGVKLRASLKYYIANSNRYTKFKKTYFPNDSKLKVDNVRSIFMLAQNISDKDPIKLANLYFREAILLTKEPNTFIDMDHVS